VAVGGVDDGVDRLVEQVALHHLENAPPGAAGGYFFLREDLRLRGTFAPARRALRDAFLPYLRAMEPQVYERILRVLLFHFCFRP